MRVIRRGRDGINVLEAPVEGWCAMPVGIPMQRTSQWFIGCRGWHKPIEQCLQIETTPCHNKRSFSTLPQLIQYLTGYRQKLRCTTLLIREEKIKQMMSMYR
jgi:hypothetical protein